MFWDSAPLDQIEAWVRSKVSAEMAPEVARGVAGARLKLSEKELLVAEADKLKRSDDH
jgi:aminopeptidase N